MLCVIREGEETVFAVHEDWQAEDIGTRYERAAIVHVPSSFVFAYDEEGERKDPRRFAGEGGMPVGS